MSTTTTVLDALLSEAVERQDLPFVVAMVADRDGVLWQGCAGQAAESSPVAPDAVFRIYSQTKGIAAAAAMILIDRGLLSMETPVASVLPEFERVRVLESLGPDGPVLRAPRTTCTLRHLLTHTSGLAYEGLDERMTAFREATPPPAAQGTLEHLFGYPMVFDPGAEFAYGVGVDWVGLMIQRIDGRTIDRFCREELFEPLGMVDTVFEPDEHRDRIPRLRQRTSDGGFTTIEVAPPPRPEFYGLGICLYSTAADYIRFLRMLLNRGELDGRRVLSERAIDLMTLNQMPDGVTVRPLESSDQPWSADIDFFPGTPKTWTAGFLRNEHAIPGMRAAGSLSWGGILNTHHWLDPANGIAAVYMTQSLPFVEPRVVAQYERFERAVYRHLVTAD
ncbi:serine hydrolase domain-containing protein [Thermopolyspora sp. NPDC052614]|uniref:serine hydrolase domain-containing protein n=1 Tax=Thermopolyspora sp. NPDC052614 TaxID=3155682 RepID=UPI0034163666